MKKRRFPFLLLALLVLVCPAGPAGDEFQAAVERVMAGQAGTAVVVDVDSGRLLASYRLEVAARTLAAPGSTLKPFTLATLLESGKMTPETSLICRRRVLLAGQTLDCTHVQVAEPLDPVSALAYSCNYFWARQGLLLDPREFAEGLRRAGLASPTKLVDEEASGTVRVPATEEEKQLEALGHSGVETTPLALLMAYRQLALKRKQAGANDVLAPLFAGLEAGTEYGTGHQAQPEGLRVAGKTGTARARSGTWTHGWFVGYAPADKPEVVVVVFLQRGRGGAEAAPLAREIFAAWQKQRSHR